MDGYIDKKLTRHIWATCSAYAAAGISWILISDSLLSYLAGPEQITRLQSWKGVLFIAVTTVLLFILIRRKNASIKELFGKLRGQIQHFQDTFEQAAVGIVHITKNEQWIRVNQTICKMLGYNHQEFKTLQLEEVIHPEDLSRGREMDQKLANGELDSYVMEKRYLTKAGTPIDSRLTKSAVRNPDGSLQYMIAIIEDITEQKQAQQKLMQSLKEKEQLLAEIHHRVKNNLAVISGLMELQAYSADHKNVQHVLKQCMMRIKSIALIHESYYESDRLAYVTLNNYLHNFSEYIQRAYPNLDVVILNKHDEESLNININQAMPCGLLISELLISCYASNGCNESNTTSVQIVMNLADDDRVTVNVKGKETSLADTSGETTLTGRIIEALARQLEATLEIEHDKENEVEVNISFIRDQQIKGSSNAFFTFDTDLLDGE